MTGTRLHRLGVGCCRSGPPPCIQLENLLWESLTDVDAVVLADRVGAEASRLSSEWTSVSSTMVAPTLRVVVVERGSGVVSPTALVISV